MARASYWGDKIAVGANCKNVVDVLRALLDGELSVAEEQELRQHLEACPPCIEFVRTYRKTSDICKKALAREMPAELADRLTSFLRSKIGAK
jgi:anti-sigma factor (TIGR02949 family)